MSTLDLYEARQQAKTEGREATVATDAAALTDPIDLIVEAFSDRHRYVDVPWLGPTGFLARRGDRALLFESDERQPWAIVLASEPTPVDADTLDGKDSTAFIEKAIADAKGDLIVGSAADAVVRKPVGANDELLVADSGQAGGVKWTKVGNAQVAGPIDYAKLNLAASVKRSDMAASLADGPAGMELTYDQFIANVTVTAASEALATSIVASSAYVFDGVTPVIVEFFAPRVLASANANDIVAFVLFDAVAGSLGVLGYFVNQAAVSGGAPVLLRRRITPSNASHTFSVRAYRTTANATVNAGAGGSGVFVPGYIRITKA